MSNIKQGDRVKLHGTDGFLEGVGAEVLKVTDDGPFDEPAAHIHVDKVKEVEWLGEREYWVRLTNLKRVSQIEATFREQ